MVQTLDVISVNFWQILISLANLLLLFLGIKKFLYKPVKDILAKRESEIADKYDSAKKAENDAFENKRKWEDRMKSADEKADSILSDATENARFRSEKIIEEAKLRAESIVRNAETEAEMEYKKSADKIKHEIIEVSSVIAEKMIGREIDTENHHALIDSFIEKIGDTNE